MRKALQRAWKKWTAIPPICGGVGAGCEWDDGTTSSAEEEEEEKRVPMTSTSTTTTTTSDEDDSMFHRAANMLLMSQKQEIAMSSGDVSELSADATIATTTTATDIPHVAQLDSWDCGVACLQMVLRWLRSDNSNLNRDNNSSSSRLSVSETNERNWMLQELSTKSIWSIDLVSILRTILIQEASNMHAKFLLCSKTLEVDRAYHDFGYYKSSFRNDEIRVNHLFENAKASEWPLLRLDYLKLTHVVWLVSQSDCVAVVLVDNSLLLSSSRRGKRQKQQQQQQQEVSRDSYAGHYIVLCGISYDPQLLAMAQSREGNTPATAWSPVPPYCMVVKNPASPNSTDYLTPQRFERAWRAKGTDDDILFVRKC